MSTRKHRLVDCNPQFITYDGKASHAPDALFFDCPEGHEDCRYHVPFTPALDGGEGACQQNGACWSRSGDTFETLTLSPSIRGIPKYASREAAIADGCMPEHVHPRMWCALHIFIRDGRIEFCGDSR